MKKPKGSFRIQYNKVYRGRERVAEIPNMKDMIGDFPHQFAKLVELVVDLGNRVRALEEERL